MRILIVSPKFHPIVGGGETYTLNMARKLSSQGWDVDVAVEPNQLRNLSNYGFNVHEVAGLSDKRLDIQSAVKLLSRLIKETRPGIIHAHGYFALLAVGLANASSIPVLASIHNTPVWNERIIGAFNDFHVELHFARSVLSVSKPYTLIVGNKVYADAAKKIIGDQIPLNVLPYPVDIPFFAKKPAVDLRTELGIDQESILITLPSRIIRRKGILEAVEALAQLPSNYHLCLPGAVTPLDLEYWHEITRSDSFKRTSSRIVIPPTPILYDELPSLYWASDVIIMPSYYEGAPLAPVEAMAAKRPVIAADSQGLRDLIKDGVNGLLCKPKDTSSLADSILEMCSSTALRERVVFNASNSIQAYSWSQQIQNLINLYQAGLHN